MSDSDSQFEEELTEALVSWTDELDVPEGLGSAGIRRARRRSARRVAAVGVPAAAAAAVVFALVSGGGSGSVSAVPRVKALNASQVYARVTAQVKQLGASDGVIETVARSNQQKHPELVEWLYTEPRPGIQYSYARTFDSHGRYVSGYWNRASRLGGGRIKNVQLNLEPRMRAYRIGTAITHAPKSELGVDDSTQQIAQHLANGDIQLDGTTTIAGQAALRLKLHYAHSAVLYVNATTYRPIEQVVKYTYHHGRLIYTDRIYLRRATKVNIAKATTRPSTKGWRQY